MIKIEYDARSEGDPYDKSWKKSCSGLIKRGCLFLSHGFPLFYQDASFEVAIWHPADSAGTKKTVLRVKGDTRGGEIFKLLDAEGVENSHALVLLHSKKHTSKQKDNFTSKTFSLAKH